MLSNITKRESNYLFAAVVLLCADQTVACTITPTAPIIITAVLCICGWMFLFLKGDTEAKKSNSDDRRVDAVFILLILALLCELSGKLLYLINAESMVALVMAAAGLVFMAAACVRSFVLSKRNKHD